MFDKKKQKTEGDFLQSFNYICVNSALTGNLTCETDLRLDGKIVGNIICKAKLVIGKDGFVKGEIQAKSAFIEGDVLGNISIEENLVLTETAKVEGNIITKQFTAKEGSKMNGQLSMSSNEAVKSPQLLTEQILS